MSSLSSLYPWERRFVENIQLEPIRRALVPLFVAFIILNFTDALTTLVALTARTQFVELNPIASHLFKMQLPGYLYAYFFKSIPVVPLFYIVFLKGSEKYDVHIRLLKFVALVVLVAADIYLGFIVLFSNLPQLISAGLI